MVGLKNAKPVNRFCSTGKIREKKLLIVIRIIDVIGVEPGEDDV